MWSNRSHATLMNIITADASDLQCQTPASNSLVKAQVSTEIHANGRLSAVWWPLSGYCSPGEPGAHPS